MANINQGLKDLLIRIQPTMRLRKITVGLALVMAVGFITGRIGPPSLHQNLEIALILLRCQASVIVTTRFPKDCAIRFSKQKDFYDWKDKLHIYGLDMRHIPSVIEFTNFINEKYPRFLSREWCF